MIINEKIDFFTDDNKPTRPTQSRPYLFELLEELVLCLVFVLARLVRPQPLLLVEQLIGDLNIDRADVNVGAGADDISAVDATKRNAIHLVGTCRTGKEYSISLTS